MALEKAVLNYSVSIKGIPTPIAGSLQCQFNPSELEITKNNEWTYTKSPAWNSPALDFQGGEPATYSLSLFFDSYATETPVDVRTYTNTLLRMTLRGAGYSMFKIPYMQPPSVKLVWGKITLFSAVLQSVKVQYILFAQDGTPIRAKADLTLMQRDAWDDYLPAQNPTSRADSRRTRIVGSHQRLDLIAFEEYGDSRYWRLLADANGLDDPFQLRDGQIMVIPDPTILG